MSGSAHNGPDCDPQAAADFLRALAHPMRLRILCRLIDGEVGVAAFESELGLKQPNLSQQLGQLREAGLVVTRREAKSVFYSLADARVGVVLDAVRRSFSTAVRAADTPQDRSMPSPLVRPALTGRPRQEPGRAEGECGMFAVAGWQASVSR